MADISGPVHTLPGHVRDVVQKPSDIIMCDEHDDVPAVKRVQGETDSFGAEYMHMCQQCYDIFAAVSEEPVFGFCDWCKKEAIEIKPTRDPGEGSCGPVYYACKACRMQAIDNMHDDDYDDE